MKARGARFAALVGRVAALEQHRDAGHRHFGSRGHDHGQAIGELQPLQLRKDGVRKLLRDRRTLLAIGDARRRIRCECRLRQYLERVITPREPLARDALQVGRLRGVDPLERLPVARRIAGVDLAGREHVGLAAEPADAFEPADEAGPDRDARALEFRRRRALVDEALQFFHHRRFDAFDRHALLDVCREREEAGDLERRLPGGGTVGQSIAVHQTLVEARRLAAAQYFADQSQVFGIAGVVGRRVPEALPARLRDLVVHRLAAAFAARGDPDPGSREGGARRDVAEVLLCLRARRRHVDVAGQHQDGVGGAVIRAEPFAHVVERRRVEVCHRTDRQAAIRMSRGEARAVDGLRDLAVRAVLVLALFVLDHAALLVEPRLRHGAEQVAHAIRFHPQREIERRGRDVLEIVGAVETRGAVHRGRTDLFQRLEIFVVVVFRALEHQVFEQMRESALAGRLVFRADVVPDVDRDDRRLAVRVDDDGQAVVELEFLVRDQVAGHRTGGRRGRWTAGGPSVLRKQGRADGQQQPAEPRAAGRQLSGIRPVVAKKHQILR